MGFPVVLSILAFSWRFAGDPVRQDLRAYSLVTFAVAQGLAVPTVAVAETDVVALAERALTLSHLQWSFVVGLRLTRLG